MSNINNLNNLNISYPDDFTIETDTVFMENESISQNIKDALFFLKDENTDYTSITSGDTVVVALKVEDSIDIYVLRNPHYLNIPLKLNI